MGTDWEECVRSRAYAICEREGQMGGEADQHWVRAEAELPDGADGTTNPGDDAAPGTAGTGEDICPACQGTGQKDGGMCANCRGTGMVIEGIGGA